MSNVHKYNEGQIVRHKKTGKQYVVVPCDSRPDYFLMRPKPGFTSVRYSMGGTGKPYGATLHVSDANLELVS